MTKIATDNLRIPMTSMVLTCAVAIGVSVASGAAIKNCVQKILSVSTNQENFPSERNIGKKIAYGFSLALGTGAGSIALLTATLGSMVLVVPRIQRKDLSVSPSNKLYLGLAIFSIAALVGTIIKERISNFLSPKTTSQTTSKWKAIRNKMIYLTSTGLGIGVGAVLLPFLLYNSGELLKCCYLSGKFSFSTGIRTFSLIVDPVRGQLAANTFTGPIINILARAPF